MPLIFDVSRPLVVDSSGKRSDGDRLGWPFITDSAKLSVVNNSDVSFPQAVAGGA
jgi:hypothetical protein